MAYTKIDNSVLLNENLSLEAKGLYSIIKYYSTIPGFSLNREHIKSISGYGETAFRRVWNELKEAGLLEHTKTRKNGRIHHVYTLVVSTVEKVTKKKTKENVKDHVPLDSDGNEPIEGQVYIDEVLERNIELLKDETGLNKEECLKVLNESDNNIIKVLEKWSIVKKLNYKKPFYALIKAIKENWIDTKKEQKKRESKFFNFEEREYDYDYLEKVLLGEIEPDGRVWCK